MKKITVSILTTLLMLSMVFSSSVFAANEEKASAWDSFLGLFSAKTAATSDVGVEYRGHIQNVGNYPLDGSWIQGPTELGTEGKGLRLEGFWIQLNGDVPADAHIEYQVHVQNVGWMDPVQDGEFAGTEGRSLQIEAIKISLVDDEGVQLEDYSVVYNGHVQNIGDVGPFTNGEQLGTVGSFLRLEAIEVEIVQNPADLTEYNAALAAVTQADYTAASWTTYQAVVNANVVDEDNLQSEVDAATANITAAQANLVLLPKVTSVNVLNAKQIQINFSRALDETTAEDTDNYAVSVGGSISGAVLSSDGKAVVLTLANAVANDTVGVVTVKQNAVATADDEDEFVAYYSGTVTFVDTTAPVLLSVTSVTNGDTATEATLTFSEPVASSTVKIDGTKATISYSVNDTVITATNLSLDAATTHTAEVINATDYADPANVTGTQSKTFSVNTDTTLPTVSVSAYTDKAFLLTFSKPLVADTTVGADVTAAQTMIDNALSSIKDETLTTLDFTTTVTLLTGDTTGTKFVVTLGDGVNDKLADLYANKSSRTLSLVFDDEEIEDTVGNLMEGVVKTVTLTESTSAPTITSITTKNETTGYLKSLTITSSKDINTVDEGLVTVVNSNGVIVALNTLVNTGTEVIDGNTVTYTAQANVAGTYSFSFAKGYITDTSIDANKSAAYSASVNLGTATTVSTFDVVAAGNYDGRDNVITVTYDEAVKGGAVTGSATDVNNYTLNGSSLPDGTTITLNAADAPAPGTVAQTIATITIPEESITTTDDAATLYIRNVKNLDGTKVVAATTAVIDIYDNVAPILEAAALDSYNSAANGTAVFTLTFSEDVEISAATLADGELIIKNGSTTALTLPAGAFAVEVVPGYPERLKVTVTGDADDQLVLNTAKTITLTTGDVTNVITDVSDCENPLTAGTVVTVSK